MTTPKSNPSQQNSQLSPEQYTRLKAEAMAPYRGLRQFIYIGFGASGLGLRISGLGFRVWGLGSGV